MVMHRVCKGLNTANLVWGEWGTSVRKKTFQKYYLSDKIVWTGYFPFPNLYLNCSFCKLSWIFCPSTVAETHTPILESSKAQCLFTLPWYTDRAKPSLSSAEKLTLPLPSGHSVCTQTVSGSMNSSQPHSIKQPLHSSAIAWERIYCNGKLVSLSYTRSLLKDCHLAVTSSIKISRDRVENYFRVKTWVVRVKVLWIKTAKTTGHKKHLIKNHIIELGYLIINLSRLLLSKSQESFYPLQQLFLGLRLSPHSSSSCLCCSRSHLIPY